VPSNPDRLAKAITVINLKGGVGKTHTAWLIAGVCQERGKRLLVVDTDTQGNITRSFLTPGQSPTPGVEALFDTSNDADPETLVRTTRFPNIDLLPSSPALARYDLSDQRAWDQSDLHFSLADGLRELRSRYDYIVFDCPPRLSLVSFAALCASQYVIIPLEAADWGAQGIVQVTAAVTWKRFTTSHARVSFTFRRKEVTNEDIITALDEVRSQLSPGGREAPSPSERQE
jgi:chromosome partitioning protein